MRHFTFSPGRKLTRLLIAGSVTVSLCLSSAAPVLADSLSATPTIQQVLSLVQSCDTDAYHILTATQSKGEDLSQDITAGNDVITAVDSVVHEEHHNYCWDYGNHNGYNDSEAYYLGNNVSRLVPETSVFPTSDAVSTIPASMHTYRYDTYVAPGCQLTSNQDGVYGLLNEFAAYYWGNHAANSMYSYCEQNATGEPDWVYYTSCFVNARDAYAEFYYWTLVYLNYARLNRPDIYLNIISNSAYTSTFTEFRQKYEQLLADFTGNMNRICLRYAGKYFKDCYTVSDGQGRLNLGDHYMTMSDDYTTLIGAISSSEFSIVRDDLADPAPKLTNFRPAEGAMYRLYNKSTGEHLFTKSKNEIVTLVNYYRWTLEGIGWYAPSSGTPVYRLYNPQTGEHFYTMDAHEKSTLVSRHHWNDEGLCWYSAPSAGGDAVYRQFNSSGTPVSCHNYTKDQNEIRVLTGSRGWKNEGIAWYGIKK